MGRPCHTSQSEARLSRMSTVLSEVPSCQSVHPCRMEFGPHWELPLAHSQGRAIIVWNVAKHLSSHQGPVTTKSWPPGTSKIRFSKDPWVFHPFSGSSPNPAKVLNSCRYQTNFLFFLSIFTHSPSTIPLGVFKSSSAEYNLSNSLKSHYKTRVIIKIYI